MGPDDTLEHLLNLQRSVNRVFSNRQRSLQDAEAFSMSVRIQEDREHVHFCGPMGVRLCGTDLGYMTESQGAVTCPYCRQALAPE